STLPILSPRFAPSTLSMTAQRHWYGFNTGWYPSRPGGPGSGIGSWLAACALAWAPASAAKVDEEYDALIIQARQGIYDPALAMLRQRVSLNPQDLRAIVDLIVIAGRAGRSAEVIE